MPFLFSVVVLALIVFAVVDIVTKPDDQVRHMPKFAWLVVVILLPLLGSVLWFTLGREPANQASAESRVPGPSPRSAPGPAPMPAPAPRRDPRSTEQQLADLEREIERERARDEQRRSADGGQSSAG